MRKIYKTISLEPMTSRLPSVVPAYIPGTTTPITFDDDALKARDYGYPSNYGLVPCNIPLPNVPYLAEIPCLICNEISGLTFLPDVGEIEQVGEECSKCICRVISFERLSIWYHKFKEYYKLLNDYGHCGTVYASAVDYYDNESKRWPDDLRLGNDRQTYIDLDEEIENMGGRPTAIPKSDTSCSTPGFVETIDDEGGFYNWICENVIPTYKLPRDLQDYWERDTLYYPDVLKWIGWFNERSQFASYTTEESCSASTSACCECVEYVKRGGAAELARMNKWYSGDTTTNGVKQRIAALNSTIIDSNTKKPKPCFLPHIISPIELQNSIEDLGEFTIFCEEYEVGVDYRTGDGYGATANTKTGTYVIKDGKVQKLTSGKGYKFNTTFMENESDDSAWETLPLSTISSAVTGYTSSKLQYIHLDSYLTDDVGNIIEGLYDVGTKKNHQPKEGEVLEPLYQKDVITNIVNIDGHDNMFKGDVIDSMKFYYKFVDGGEDSATEKTVSDKLKVVETINNSTSVKNTKETTYTTEDDGEQTRIVTSIYDDDIYCDVKYHVGNIYVLYETTDEHGKKVQKSRLATSSQDGFDGHGVEYTETVQFEKTRVEYYLKTEDRTASPSDVSKPTVHSVSYPIYVYKLKQKEDIIESNTYNTPYADNLSEFNITAERKYDTDYNTPTDPNEHCDSNSGDTKSPIIREDYRFGIAAPESVKSNIYIDRGINSAFEKHLKLGEVTSLESLLQYGNGYFKIMEN